MPENLQNKMTALTISRFLNRKTLAGCMLLLCLVWNTSYSQNQSNKTDAKLGAKLYPRPLAFDSSKTLEEQYKKESPYFLTGIQLYLPLLIDANEGPVVFAKPGAVFPRGNARFTVVDIIPAGGIAVIRKKKLVNVCGYKHKEPDRHLNALAVFVLRENKKPEGGSEALFYWVITPAAGSTYSASSFTAFIPLPYLEKQKQLYEGQPLIMLKDKDKWTCLKVDVLKGRDAAASDSVYDVYCILKGENYQFLVLRPPSEKYGRPFLTEKEYERLNHANRNQKLEMQEAEKKQQELHLASCIARFGEEKGKLVAAQFICTGMSADMCRQAWGEPWEIVKEKDTSAKAEYWHYSEKYSLRLENGVLVKITQEK
jgi:hypothetical protein